MGFFRTKEFPRNKPPDQRRKYWYLEESYRDDGGKVSKNQKYIGRKGSIDMEHKKCVRCGKKELTYQGICADCLAEDYF